MTRRANPDNKRRRGETNPVVIVLLAGILVALVVLIVVLCWPGNESNGPDGPGPEPPPPIDEPTRIKEIAKEGKTYEILVKGTVDARVEDKKWGVGKVTNLGFMFETLVDRHIESNDGKRIVEIRHFKSARAVKLLCDTDIKIELGKPGVAVLTFLSWKFPPAAAALVAVKPIAEAIASAGGSLIANYEMTKSLARFDSLTDKKVRITYVDGVGVQSLDPLGCKLTSEEHDFLMTTAVLSDYHILPDLKMKVGGTWSVNGSQFAGFLDPSMRGVPSGDIVAKRDSDYEESENQYATLRIESGDLQIDASDASKRRLGVFVPRGTLQYNITEGHVETANLHGALRIEEVSEDHLLFETSFKTQPNLKISYSCKIQ